MRSYLRSVILPDKVTVWDVFKPFVIAIVLLAFSAVWASMMSLHGELVRRDLHEHKRIFQTATEGGIDALNIYYKDPKNRPGPFSYLADLEKRHKTNLLITYFCLFLIFLPIPFLFLGVWLAVWKYVLTLPHHRKADGEHPENA